MYRLSVRALSILFYYVIGARRILSAINECFTRLKHRLSGRSRSIWSYYIITAKNISPAINRYCAQSKHRSSVRARSIRFHCIIGVKRILPTINGCFFRLKYRLSSRSRRLDELESEGWHFRKLADAEQGSVTSTWGQDYDNHDDKIYRWIWKSVKPPRTINNRKEVLERSVKTEDDRQKTQDERPERSRTSLIGALGRTSQSCTHIGMLPAAPRPKRAWTL